MKKVTIKACSFGKGVFAELDIEEGEEILAFSGTIYTKDDLPNPYTPENDRYLQCDDDAFMGPSGEADDYVNHSCSPNTGILDENNTLKLFAILPIKKGEQLFFDYSTAMHGYLWDMDCCCGSLECRERIGNFVTLPQKIQQQYLNLNIVPQFIVKKIHK